MAKSAPSTVTTRRARVRSDMRTTQASAIISSTSTTTSAQVAVTVLGRPFLGDRRLGCPLTRFDW